VGNDYENIQKLYEEGYRGLDYNPGPNAKYTANMSPNGYSYRKGQLPTGYPGAGGYSQYNYAQAGGYQVPTVAIIADEEKPIPQAEIINLDVLKKLDELLEDAETHDMAYAIHSLGNLRDHIISLSQ
jgi:hypothetical protein